ncbi:MAG TPA: class I SAM-dependent methyltransferase [Acidimicrobiia bacterium]
MTSPRRTGFLGRVGKGIRHPSLAWAYLRRTLRNKRLSTDEARTSHLAFYRRVMADDVAHKTARGAVGTADPEEWLELGERQFRYLADHGLRLDHRMLEIGCGNLRAGWRFIEFLGVGAYTGVDISPEILIAAEETLAERGLQAKRPYLFLVDDMSFAALPEAHFDVVHAHSVFSHSPVEVVEAVLAGIRRVIRPDGFFDFTYNESADGTYWGVLREDFFYPRSMLVDLAARYGYTAEPMPDWVHPQAKLRLRPHP